MMPGRVEEEPSRRMGLPPQRKQVLGGASEAQAPRKPINLSARARNLTLDRDVEPEEQVDDEQCHGKQSHAEFQRELYLQGRLPGFEVLDADFVFQPNFVPEPEPERERRPVESKADEQRRIRDELEECRKELQLRMRAKTLGRKDEQTTPAPSPPLTSEKISSNPMPRTQSDELRDALRQLPYRNDEDEPVSYVSHHDLDPVRRKVFATAFPECEGPDQVVQVMTENTEKVPSEQTVVVKSGGSTSADCRILTGECLITCAELPPSSCVEYSFREEPGNWALAKISEDGLGSYRSRKFHMWKNMLENPDCEAQFRRMLQIGPVMCIFDTHIFPTPDHLKDSYQVTDERTGKVIDLPHPVSLLRKWDARKQSYIAVVERLDGAPSEFEEDAWWEEEKQKLMEQHGAEYVTGMIAGRS